MNLYEIDEQILSCVDLDTGEVIDEEMLDQLAMERDRKLENIACWVKNLKAEISAFKEEEKNLKNRREVLEHKQERLSNYLQKYLNGSKFETAKCKISYRKSEKVEVSDLDSIPEEFLKVTVEPKKSDIKQALKNGETIEGATLVQTQSMTIK